MFNHACFKLFLHYFYYTTNENTFNYRLCLFILVITRPVAELGPAGKCLVSFVKFSAYSSVVRGQTGKTKEVLGETRAVAHVYL